MTVNLTTVDRVKTYLDMPLTQHGADSKIANLIPVESRQACNWIGRSVPSAIYTRKKLDGTGTRTLCLPDAPIVSVDLLMFGNTVIPASPDGFCQYGFIVDDQALTLIGDVFPRQRQFITCSWTSGWVTTETDVIPAPAGNATASVITPLTEGLAAVDRGVSYANGAALALTTSNTPAAGQYAFTIGAYTFSAAEAGATVTMAYAYVPSPIEQAVIEMVGLDLKQRDNLGVNSKSLAGETISYSSKGMTDSAKEMLQPYKRMSIA